MVICLRACRVFSLSMLERLEAAHMKGPCQGPLPVRVKALRQHLIEIWGDEKAPEDARRARPAMHSMMSS
jgi:hypothetical protein